MTLRGHGTGIGSDSYMVAWVVKEIDEVDGGMLAQTRRTASGRWNKHVWNIWL
jgi:hypothetical protein